MGKLWMSAAVVALPLAGVPAAPDGGHAAGSGDTGTWSFELAAESDAGGSNPHGFLRAQTDDDTVFVAGRVICLSVFLNEAGVEARIVRASDPDLVGGDVQLTVADIGNPMAGEPADLASQPLFSGPPPPETSCPRTSEVSKLVRGNVDVRDAELPFGQVAT